MSSRINLNPSSQLSQAIQLFGTKTLYWPMNQFGPSEQAFHQAPNKQRKCSTGWEQDLPRTSQTRTESESFTEEVPTNQTLLNTWPFNQSMVFWLEELHLNQNSPIWSESAIKPSELTISQTWWEYVYFLSYISKTFFSLFHLVSFKLLEGILKTAYKTKNEW